MDSIDIKLQKSIELIYNNPHILKLYMNDELKNILIGLSDINLKQVNRLGKDDNLKVYDKELIVENNKITIFYPEVFKYAIYDDLNYYIQMGFNHNADEYELVSTTQPQKIEVKLSKNANIKDAENIQNIFSKIIYKKYGINPEIELSYNNREKWYELLFINCYVENEDQKIKLIDSVLSDMDDSISELIPHKYNTLKNNKTHSKHLTILSPSKISTIKDELQTWIDKKVSTKIEDTIAQYFVSITENNKNSLHLLSPNINVQIDQLNINNINNVENINIGNNINNKIVNNIIDNPKNDYDQFINYILEKKPSWYKPNEWIHNQIIMNNFNLLYPRKSHSVLGKKLKGRLYDEIKIYKIEKKTSRCVKLRYFKDIC